MIEDLTSLAKEKSSEKRRELLGRVSDIFFEGAEKYSDQEAFLFGDVLTSLLDDVDVEAKVQLSVRLADEDRSPRALATALAGDESLAVAAPVLQKSNALHDEDIVEIAKQHSQEHLMAISKRVRLGETVTDVLIEHGEKRVLQSVVMNTGANFSETGFASLADKAVADDNLKEALSHRSDMPAEIAQRVLPLLPRDARARLLELMANDPEKGAQLVHMAKDASERQRLLAKKRRLEAKVMAEDIRAGRLDIDKVVSDLADANRITDLAMVLATVAEIPANVLTNIILKPDGQPIAMLCCTLDITSAAFRAIAEMRSRRMKTPASLARQMTTKYASIDRPSADRAIRFIKMRTTMGKEAAA